MHTSLSSSDFRGWDCTVRLHSRLDPWVGLLGQVGLAFIRGKKIRNPAGFLAGFGYAPPRNPDPDLGNTATAKDSRSPLGALLPFQRFDRVDDHGKYLSDPVTTADYTK